MLPKAFLFLILLFKINLSLSSVYTVPDVNFMESMTDGNKFIEKILKNNSKNIALFHDNYEAKKPSKMQYQKTPLIPKIMHQIWLGSSNIPPLYQHYLDECKKLHPDWEFKFWSDKDIDELGLEYRDIYDKARNYSSRSDIARYEILYRFGGVYRDMDVKCFRPIDDLNYKYTFFAPIEPIVELKKDRYELALNNGIIGSNPQNPILKSALDIIRSGLDKSLNNFDQNALGNVQNFAIEVSMWPLTQGFLKETHINDKNVGLPSTYFLSLLNFAFKSSKFSKDKVIYGVSHNLSEPQFHFLKQESLMFHNFRPDKREIPYADFRYGNHMGSIKIQLILKSLDASQKKLFKTFEAVYNERIPRTGSLPLNKESKTPQKIHFIIFDDIELSILQKNLVAWKVLNGDFDIKIWDKKELIKSFGEINFDRSDKEDIRFYWGLKILEKLGGSYAHFKAVPHEPIFELTNKFSFYAGMMPIISSESSVLISKKLLGSMKAHPIIANTLKSIDYNNPDSLKKIIHTFTLETYKGLYLNGTNVVLPAIYFEPIDTNYSENILDKIKRVYNWDPQPFSSYTQFTVIE